VRYEEVRDLLDSWGIAIVPKDAALVRGLELDVYRGLAMQTEDVDSTVISKTAAAGSGDPATRTAVRSVPALLATGARKPMRWTKRR
jgi:hypothetical protein